jgi:antitoxin HigA-1
VSAPFAPAPPRPDEVLKRYFLTLEGVTQQTLADAMRVSRLTVNELLNGKRAVTAPMAVRLGRVLGTDADFWLNLQMAWDLHKARVELINEIEGLKPLREERTVAEVVKPPRPQFDARERSRDP